MLQALPEADTGCCSHRKGSTEDKQCQNPALRLVLAETHPVHWHCLIQGRRNTKLAELMGIHGIKASRQSTNMIISSEPRPSQGTQTGLYHCSIPEMERRAVS